MKYLIESRKAWIAILYVVIFGFVNCSSSESRKIAKPATTSKILRLTYDSIWNPKSDFTLRESNNNSSNEISYTIDYASTEREFLWLKISSTDQENKHSFRYLLKEQNDVPIKVFYFPWQSSRATILLKQKELSNKLIQCRWEAVYNGYLLVVEGEFDNKDDLLYAVIAQKFQNHILANLYTY